MTYESETPGSDSPENIGHARVQSHLTQEKTETGDHELAVGGGAVVTGARRGARHRIIIMGSREVDRQLEE